MEKINFVWSKAQSQLGQDLSDDDDENFAEIKDRPRRLEKLERDLAMFDSLYYNLKHSDGLHSKTEAKSVDEIDTKLESLLQRYDLEDTIYAFRMKYKYDQARLHSANNDESEQHSDHESKTFQDPRLAKIWETAKGDRSFSLGELDDVFYDLREQEQKLEEYNTMLKEVSEYEQQHNHILKEDDDQAELHQHRLATVKQMNQALETNLAMLQNRVTELTQNPFKNRKVRRLWEKALKSGNLMPNELDAIKHELRHFESQLEKVAFHKEQLNDAEEFSRGAGKDAQDEHTAQLREYHEKLARKIKKLEHYLDEKLTAVHNEL
ncbi:alpha-2-macroglobulin receptor-associated protein [Ditylenchus destructor]|nr:alpha-2-macroglobulin receptor-associated protein [Ditylenchus destructor]